MVKIALVASSGGHLFQLHSLQDFWGDKDRFWVSFKTRDAEYLLKDERTIWASFPTNRNLKNLWKNFFLARSVLKKERPDCIISTGAGVAVPFFVWAKLMGIKSLYLESITRSNELSLTGRIIYFFCSKILVQWPELARRYKKTEYHGRII